MLLIAVAALLAMPPLFNELVPDRPAAAAAAISQPRGGPYRVYVADWGYHTSIIVEQPAGSRLGPPGRESARFVEYAWGDRRFYMEADHRPHSLFAALFLPTESVVYLAAWDSAPDSVARPRALYVRAVDAAELGMLLGSLESQIRRGGASAARADAFAPAAGYDGRFYPAHGRYLWWSDCNRWTADRLQAAGLARGGRGVLFSGQVAPRLVGFRRWTVGQSDSRTAGQPDSRTVGQ
jgi:hypothetical protein